MMLKNKKQYVVLIISAICIMFSLAFFWFIKVQYVSRPIQHTVNSYSNEVSVTLGLIREIVIQGNASEEMHDIEIVISDLNGNVCYQQIYEQYVFDGNMQSLESFTREKPLVLDGEKYIVSCIVDNAVQSNAKVYLIEYSGSYNKLYFVLSMLIVITYIVIGIIYINKLPLGVSYVIITIMLGIIYNYIMPPLGVPDERSHFFEAYELSSRMMLQEPYNETGNLLMRQQDYLAIKYLHNAASISEWNENFMQMGSEKMVPVTESSTVSTRAPHAYMASATGIMIGRMLGVNGPILLVMGRMFNLILLSIIVGTAIYLIPYGKYFIMVLGMLPEVIYLFASYSYDGLNFALCTLIVAWYLYICNRGEKIKLREIIILVIIILLMLPIKVVYIAFGGLVFLLPKDKIELSKKQIKWIVVLSIIGVLGFLIVCVPIVLTNVNMSSVSLGRGYEEEVISIGYIVNNKLQTLIIYLNTIFGNAESYLEAMFVEIVGVGRYKNLDRFYMPNYLMALSIIFMLAGLADTESNFLKRWKRNICMGILVFTFLAILTSMFLACTTIGSGSIWGVQGRYFLPLMVLAPLCIKNEIFSIKKNVAGICILGMGYINLYFIILMFNYYAATYFA